MSVSRLAHLRHAIPAVLPSLLLCDFGNLEREVRRLEDAGVAGLHLDVMDGHFVPNLTYGMPIVEGLRRLTDLPLDVHLMISDPVRYAGDFVAAGADLLTFHVEAVENPLAAVESLRSLEVGVGVALNPATPLEKVFPVAGGVDLVLVMSVEAGFGGQAFHPGALQKLSELRSRHPDLCLEVDGGVHADTIGPCREAGADLFVVGSALFRRDDYAQALSQLQRAMGR